MPPKQKRTYSTETHTGHEEDSQQLQAGGTSEQKNTRPDRAAKKAKRSEENETVVKACLIRHIHGDDSQKHAMQDALRARVLSFSKRVRVASLGLTPLVKKMFDGVEDVSTVQVPDKYFEQTFVRQLLLGTQDASKLVRSSGHCPLDRMNCMMPWASFWPCPRCDLPRSSGCSEPSALHFLSISMRSSEGSCA